MRNMLVFTAFAAALALAGCSSAAYNLSINSGDVLSVDANGHMTSDIVYQGTGWKMTLKATGSYEFQNFSYEYSNDLNYNKISNEGWVQIGGYQGAYNWNTTNYVMNVNYSAEFRNTNALVASAYMSAFSSANADSRPYIFTTRYYYSTVYVKSPADTSGKTFGRTVITSNTNSYNTTDESYVIDITAKTMAYSCEAKSYSSSNTILTFVKTNANYIILTNLPDGAAFDSGKTLTFQLQVSSETDIFSNFLIDITNAPLFYFTTLTFTHGGNFLIANGISSASARAPWKTPLE